jgi:hypothetical protein
MRGPYVLVDVRIQKWCGIELNAGGCRSCGEDEADDMDILIR